MYLITVKDSFFNKELTGKFKADTKKEATLEAKKYYAMELDTFPEEIKIVDVTED